MGYILKPAFITGDKFLLSGRNSSQRALPVGVLRRMGESIHGRRIREDEASLEAETLNWVIV
jgi:hypothetical protein